MSNIKEHSYQDGRPLTSSSTPSTTSTEHSLEKPVAQDALQENDDLARQSTEPEYPPTRQVIPVMLGLFLVQFLVALDRTIIATAIPKITDEFNSLGDIGWYASAYMLTACSFALFLGRIYTFYDPKWVYLTCIAIFEIGSTVCGAAPSSTALIVGRAVAGLGSAGLFQGAIVIVVNILPLHKRPAYMGFFGMVFGVASVTGPLLGGAFTDSVTWRWCFYINLPIGGVTLVLLGFMLRIPAHLKKSPTSLSEKIQRLDPIGTLLFLPAIVCLLLALQWGGLQYNWANARIIVLLVLFGLLIIAFIVVQHFKGVNGTVPPHIFLNRSILAGMWYGLCVGSAMMTYIYYLPIYFQAIKGDSAVHSGILTIPLVISLVVASIASGILTRKVGYYAPWMLASSIIFPIGAGLITTFSPTTSTGKWIGYQIIFGFGLGLGIQQPSVAAQTVLSKKDVPTGASLMFFSQQIGGTVFISIANNLFDDKLATGLKSIPGVNVQNVIMIGATDLKNVVSAALLPQVLEVYNAALRNAFYVGLSMSCAGILGAVAMEWRSVKKDAQQGSTKKIQDTEQPSDVEAAVEKQ